SFVLTGDAPAGFVLNADGSWSFDPSDAAYQSLAVGDQLAIVIPYQVTDATGVSGPGTLTITISGANDAPVITSAAQTGGVAEDGTLVAGGQVTASDIDNGSSATFSGSASGAYGSFVIDAATGVW